MNLRITIEGRTYDVQVEFDDSQDFAPSEPTASAVSSSSRVEGLSLGRIPARSNPRNGLAKARAQAGRAPQNGGSAPSPSTPAVAPPSALPSAAPQPAPSAPPAPIKPAWHGLGTGESGEVVSPIAGRIRAICVSPGQKVKPGDALVELQASATYSPGDRPLQGTLRATKTGVIEKIEVAANQSVQFRQRLLIIRPEQAS